MLKRLCLFAAGIFIMALGVSFSVKSNLGVSPVTSVPFVLSRIFGVTLGTTTVFYYIFCMGLQAVILRREYRIINLLQIVASFAFGLFTDVTTSMISFMPVTENYIVRLLYLAAGIACVAFGILLYLTTNLIALPTDGTVQAISHKGRFALHKVKIVYDCVSTALALLLSLAVLGSINGIGVGTVIAAVATGRMLGIFSKLFKNRLLRLLGMTPVTAISSATPEGAVPARDSAEKAAG
jgi:uncharacterized membrane protein YczE